MIGDIVQKERLLFIDWHLDSDGLLVVVNPDEVGLVVLVKRAVVSRVGINN
jgi:hypothetical protein